MAFVRNPLQDWSHAPNYLPRDLWDKELSPEVQQRQKLDMLLAHFIALGLRWPSESTIKVLASLYILCAENDSQAFTMSSPMKYETFRAVKTAFKYQVEKKAQPVLICNTLPAEPNSFQIDFKPLWDGVFGEHSSGWPVPSQIPFVDLHRVMVDMPMRSSNFGSRDGFQPKRSCQLADNNFLAPQSMQQFQQQMMNQFQGFAMAAMQQWGAGHLHQGVLPKPALQLHFPSALPSPGTQHAIALPDLANHPRTIQRLSSRIEASTTEPVAQTQPLALIAPVQPSQHLSANEQSDHDKSEPSNKKSVLQVAASIQKSFDDRAADKKEEKKKKKNGKTKKQKKKQPPKAGKHPAPTKPATPVPDQKRPCVGHEASRNQYMGRTGLPGKGQTKAFKYSDKKGSREMARQEADRWLAEQMEARGFK
jgi:hypothetical protein